MHPGEQQESMAGPARCTRRGEISRVSTGFRNRALMSGTREVAIVKRTVLCMLAALPLAGVRPAVADPPTYRISVSGPQVTLEHTCGDPCHYERIDVVGKVGMEAELSDDEGEKRRPIRDSQGRCVRDCDERGAGLKIQPPRDLKRGIEFTIEDRWAHFVFYSVTETDSGPATKRRHFEFQVDRPVIDVSLGEHELRLEANVGEGSLMKRDGPADGG